MTRPYTWWLFVLESGCMIKRIIVDIDYTLLKPNYDREPVFFEKYVPSDNDYFIYHMYEILKEYEDNHVKYELNTILEHLNKYSSGIELDKDFFYDWVKFSTELDEQDVSIVCDVLSYLSGKYELVAFSNWVRDSSIKKLQKLDLLKYFTRVYGGDDYLKPYPESYHLAIGNYKPEECFMIGDNLNNDVIGAINAGLQAIHYTNGKDVNHEYPKIKCLSELKDLF